MATAFTPSPVEVSVDVVVGRNETVAFVSGEIDLATCQRLREAIEPHLAPNQRVVLDLVDVHFMDSSCLGVFLKARTRLSEDGGSLILRNPSTAARTLLSAAGIAALFQLEIG